MTFSEEISRLANDTTEGETSGENANVYIQLLKESIRKLDKLESESLKAWKRQTVNSRSLQSSGAECEAGGESESFIQKGLPAIACISLRYRCTLITCMQHLYKNIINIYKILVYLYTKYFEVSMWNIFAIFACLYNLYMYNFVFIICTRLTP